MEERGQTELPLHEVAHEHHEFLRESLKQEEVVTHIVHVAAVALDAQVDFLEEVVFETVNLAEHFAATVFLAQTQTVVDRGYMQRLLEYAQVGQCREIADAEVGGNHSLIVDADEHHEVLHATHTPTRFALGWFMLEKLAKKSHNVWLITSPPTCQTCRTPCLGQRTVNTVYADAMQRYVNPSDRPNKCFRFYPTYLILQWLHLQITALRPLVRCLKCEGRK